MASRGLMPPPSRPSTSRSTRTSTGYTRESTSFSYRSSTYESQSRSTSFFSSDGAPTRPGTAAPSTTSGRKSRNAHSAGTGEENLLICAISEARGVTPSIGLAMVNVTTAEAILSQINDTQLYYKTAQKIHVYKPSVILFPPGSAAPSSRPSLWSVVNRSLPGVDSGISDRKYWSESDGLHFVDELAFKDDLAAIKVALQGNFYACCAFSAVMHYLNIDMSVDIASHSLRIRYEACENSMMIDPPTIRGLELIQNLQDVKSKDCLFGLLNHTVTPMGSRFLRSSILQPSTQKHDVLVPRYAAVEELSGDEEMFRDVSKALRQFEDIEKLLTRLVVIPREPNPKTTEQAVNNVLKIKDFVSAVPALRAALRPAQASLLSEIRHDCLPQRTDEILTWISEVINADVHFAKSALDLRHQRTYAVKSGIEGLLDVARTVYKETTEKVHEYVDRFNAEHGLAADLKYESNRGYYLRFRATDFEDGEVPDVLINKVRVKQFLQCQTIQLKGYNQRLAEMADETLHRSDTIIERLLADIRTRAADLFRICEGIATLDMVMSFAHLVTTREYVRPHLHNDLAVREARHPLLSASRPEKFVPNDYYTTGQLRFQIVTGCNMSGKSTYIRGIALMHIMAQVGCFVPARSAYLPIVHNLFSRISTDDSIETNMSTFSVEMSEMAFILRNINGKSLAIIDELGRGTSTREGLAIAIAIAEALIQSRATVFFATHFIELAHVLADRPEVRNLHLATETSAPGADDDEALPKLTMLYHMLDGPARQSSYGIALARAVGFPVSFIARADEVAAQMRAHHDARSRRTQAHDSLHAKRKLVLELRENLVRAERSPLDDDGLRRFLRDLQGEFIERMDEIEEVDDERSSPSGDERNEYYEDGEGRSDSGDDREEVSTASRSKGGREGSEEDRRDEDGDEDME